MIGPAQEADVLLVYVDVEKAAHLPGLVAQVSLQFRKPFIENREQFSQVRGRTGDRAYARRVPPQGGWNLYRDRHFLLSTTLPPSPLLSRLNGVQRLVQINRYDSGYPKLGLLTWQHRRRARAPYPASCSACSSHGEILPRSRDWPRATRPRTKRACTADARFARSPSAPQSFPRINF